jgi:hypothetical protein
MTLPGALPQHGDQDQRQDRRDSWMSTMRMISFDATA